MSLKTDIMNTKDNILNDANYEKLLHNDKYYQLVFKKTEKIVSVIFYILNNIDVEKKSETHTSNLASKAHFAHENALRSLEVKPATAKEVLEQFAQSLIGLESTVRVTAAASVISQEIVTVLTTEINTVLRSLNQFMQSEQSFSSSLFTDTPAPARQSVPAKKSSLGRTQTAVDVQPTTTTVTDRRTRIQTILEAKGEATIKDISEIVSDVSEKTIQRELNTMIEEGVVKRQGERRWSKYMSV